MARLRNNPKQVKKVVNEIKKLVRRYGLEITRNAMNRWSADMRDKIRLERQKKDLQKKLRDINKRLSA